MHTSIYTHIYACVCIYTHTYMHNPIGNIFYLLIFKLLMEGRVL